MSDPTVLVPPRSITVDNGTRVITTDAAKKAAQFILVLLGTAANVIPNDIRPPVKQPVFVDPTVDDRAWKPAPLLITLGVAPADLTQGWDNFSQWFPPPDFIQERKPALLTTLTAYVPYSESTDVLFRGKRIPYWPEPAIWAPQRNAFPFSAYTVPPSLPGDLTTLLRRPQNSWESPIWAKQQLPAWHIVFMPQVAPGPPPPPQPGPTPWPQPSAITNLPCRGAWELPGGQQAIWVVGTGCFLMTVATPASAYTPATFALKRVGTLLTSTGQVGIRDNGAGGTVVIVDGPNGYFYTIATQKFVRITDPAFLGADKVAFIDGWWVFNQPKTQTFYVPKSTYSTTFNASNFALADGATDLLVSLQENKQELWLLCEKHTEIWYDAGGQFFPFQRLVSTMLQVGCAAAFSVARFTTRGQDGLIWLARSERGQNVVVQTQGFEANVVSTPAVADEIATYQKVSDAFGYTYQEDGHEFYVLTFPSADVTWVYDGSTELWHKRASYDPYSDTFHRHRSNCFLNFQNQRLVGDYQNGFIYRMDRSTYTDAGWPLVSWRRTPHIWDGAARERVFMASLQIEFAPGVGQPSGNGTDPQAVLTISRDGGTSWSQQFKRSIGKIGAYLNRCIWRKLSFARDTVIDVKVIDPVKRDVVGATLKRGANE